MSDVLTLALNTTNKLSNIDRKHFLGGKLANASSIFLNTTSTLVANILNTKFNRLNGLIATKTNIATKMLHISTNFINKTGNLLIKLKDTARPLFVPGQKSKITQKILSKSINLVNVTGQSLANVINATSVLLTKSVDDHTQFVTSLLNSTANILNATTNSLGNLLNTTNHLIVDVIHSKVNTSALVLNQTANLLSASSKTVSSFLNATTLLINNAASGKLTVGGHNFTIGGLNIAHNALKTVFRSTAKLLQGVISAKKDISTRLITATGAFLDASIQIKSSIFNKTIDAKKHFTNTTTHLIASKLHATADKLISHLGGSIVSNKKPLADTESNGEMAIATENDKVETENTEIPTENNQVQTENVEVSPEQSEVTDENGKGSGDTETSRVSVDETDSSKSLEFIFNASLESEADKTPEILSIDETSTTGAVANQTFEETDDEKKESITTASDTQSSDV